MINSNTLKSNELNQDYDSVAQQLVTARYGRKAKKILDQYLEAQDFTKDFADTVIETLESQINDPFEYEGYEIPDVVEENRILIIDRLNNEIEQLQQIDELAELKVKIYELFDEKNFLIKYATRQWLLLNPGIALEFNTVDDDLFPEFLQWIQAKFDIGVGDHVVQRHVISNAERIILKECGLNTPHDHWDKQYYVESMRLIQEIVKSNPNCVGIISDGSWIYNPKLYEIAEDGEPYASFTFLKDDKLTGHRFFYMTALPGNEQENQYLFATSSPRRKRYVEEGKLSIDVYMIIYPRDELLEAEI